MPVKQRPERGLIYLSGLLHNFGHLLLGHIFPPQFKLINQTILSNPHISVEDIEFYILGVSHEEIGAWLMQNWHMPDELIVAVHRHHQEEFWSKHAVYSNLVLVANRMLKKLDIGDSVMTTIPETTLELLALDIDDVDGALEDIKTESESLDMMAKQLVA
jgi:HD-like signal output (HDOD) protein